MATQQKQYKLKVILIGDSGVGKTSIASRFRRGQFEEDVKATPGGKVYQGTSTAFDFYPYYYRVCVLLKMICVFGEIHSFLF